MAKKLKVRIGETSSVLADELRRMLSKMRKKESKISEKKKQNNK